MPRYVLTPAANADIDHAWEYLWERNPKAADDVVTKLYETFHTLAENPLIGRERKELDGTPRSFPLSRYPFVIFYRPTGNGIRVLRVLHSAQDIEQAY